MPYADKPKQIIKSYEQLLIISNDLDISTDNFYSSTFLRYSIQGSSDNNMIINCIETKEDYWRSVVYDIKIIISRIKFLHKLNILDNQHMLETKYRQLYLQIVDIITEFEKINKKFNICQIQFEDVVKFYNYIGSDASACKNLNLNFDIMKQNLNFFYQTVQTIENQLNSFMDEVGTPEWKLKYF